MNELEAAWQKVDEVARANCPACQWIIRARPLRIYQGLDLESLCNQAARKHTSQEYKDAAADAMQAAINADREAAFCDRGEDWYWFVSYAESDVEATIKALKEK